MALPTKLTWPHPWRTLERARRRGRPREPELRAAAEFLARLVEADVALVRHRADDARPMPADARAAATSHHLTDTLHWIASSLVRRCGHAHDHDAEPGGMRPPMQAIRPCGMPSPPPVAARGCGPVQVLALGGFELRLDGRPWAADGRTPRKPLALLKLLVIAGERGVDEDRLIEALWPDPLDGPGQKAFDVTLHRLRRLLGHDDAVRVRQRRVALEGSVAWVDAWALERALAAADEAWHGLLPDRDTLERVLEVVRAHWRGPLLPDDRDLIGLPAARQRLQARVERWALALGDRREADGDLDGAAQLYRRLLDVEPLHPGYQRRLAAALRAAGRHDEAQAVLRGGVDVRDGARAAQS